MAVLTSLPTLHCPQFAQHMPLSTLQHPNVNAMSTVKKENKAPKAAETPAGTPAEAVKIMPAENKVILTPTNTRTAVSHDSPQTMEQAVEARRSSEVATEARLAQIPGRMPHDTTVCTPDPERIDRLCRERAAALEGLKSSMVFQPCTDMDDAIQEIRHRQAWKDGFTDNE